MKGISTVIAALLMLIITIALAGFAYTYISGTLTSKTSTAFSVVDSFGDTVTISNDGTEVITSFSSVKVDNNDAVYRVDIQDSSLVGYWRMDEGSGNTVSDSSTNGRSGTLNGVNINVPNSGFEDGTGGDANSWTEATNHARSNEKAHSGSFSLKSTFSGPGVATVLTNPLSVSPSTTYILQGYIYRDASFTGNAYLDLTDIPEECETRSSPSITNEWQFVSCTFTTSATTTGIIIRAVTDGPSSGTAWFDDVIVTQWVNGRFGKAVSFDGTDDYIDLPDGFSDFRSGFTVEVWAYPTQVQTWARFIDFGNGAISDNILLARNSGSNEITFEVYYIDQSGISRSGGKVTTTTVPIVLNTWQHFVATEDSSGNVKIYKNGDEIKSGTTAVPRNIVRTSNFIGRSNWPDAYYKGMIDEVRIYDRALSPSDVKALYTIGSQINAGQTATMKIYNQLSPGTHTLRLCTSSMCTNALLTIT